MQKKRRWGEEGRGERTCCDGEEDDEEDADPFGGYVVV